MTYGAGGLMKTLTDPRDGGHTFSYDRPAACPRPPATPAQTLAPQRLRRPAAVTLRRPRGADDLPHRGAAERRDAAHGDRRGRPGDADRHGPRRRHHRRAAHRHEGDHVRARPALGHAGADDPDADDHHTRRPPRHREQPPADLADPTTRTEPANGEETVTVNGRTSTTATRTLTKRFTIRRPRAHGTTRSTAHGGRCASPAPGTCSRSYAYDARGRLTRAGTDARIETLGYPPRAARDDHRPARPDDPFTYDPAGRATRCRPDGRRVRPTTRGQRARAHAAGAPGHAITYTPLSRRSPTRRRAARPTSPRRRQPDDRPTGRRGETSPTTPRPGRPDLSSWPARPSTATRRTRPARHGRAAGELLGHGYDGGLLMRTVNRPRRRHRRARLRRRPAARHRAVNGADSRVRVRRRRAADPGWRPHADPGPDQRARDRGRARREREHDTRYDGSASRHVGATAGGGLYAAKFALDNSGRISKAGERSQGGRDPRLRLRPGRPPAQVRKDGAVQATYGYDANGNRTQVVRAGEDGDAATTTRIG